MKIQRYDIYSSQGEGYMSEQEYGDWVLLDDVFKLLREKARHLKQVSKSIAMDEYMSDEDAAVPENGAYYLTEFADALIKGEK